MDLRVLVLTTDRDIAELVRTQAENLGCRCSVAEGFDQGLSAVGWAEAAVVDLAGDGIADLNRLRVEAPLMRILALSPDEATADAARSAGAHNVLVEPLSIAEVIEAVRALGASGDAQVLDLRTGERQTAPAVDDEPWWATKSR